MRVSNNTKLVVSLLISQGSIRFLIKKAEYDSNEGKRQIRDRTRESDFRRHCLKEEKLSSIKCVVMRLRNYTVRKRFHCSGVYIYM